MAFTYKAVCKEFEPQEEKFGILKLAKYAKKSALNF
jgi:hypothetical protein